MANLEPGFTVVPPLLYRITTIVKLLQIPLLVDTQTDITKDNVVVRISTTLLYTITDVNAYVYQNKDSVLSLVQDTRANLRGIIGNMDLLHVLLGTTTLNQTLFQQIATTTAGYGLLVHRVKLHSLQVDATLQDSLLKLLRASRTKTAKLHTATGTKQAAIAKATGTKQAAILTAEANKQTQILQAQGHATSQRHIAAAVKDQINSINAGYIHNGDLYLLYKNVTALTALAKGTANTVVLPSTAIHYTPSLPAVDSLFNQKQPSDSTKTK